MRCRTRRSFRLRQPYPRQHIPDQRPLDLADQPVTHFREGVGLQPRDPLVLMLAVFPSPFVFRVDHLGSPAERWDALSLLFLLGDAVDALGDFPRSQQPGFSHIGERKGFNNPKLISLRLPSA